MSRSKAQREQDRADILAVLEDGAAPMWAVDVVSAARGLRPGEWPSTTEAKRAFTDLLALRRQGLVVCEHRWASYNARWALAGDTTITARRDEREDVDDVRRLMAGWEPADDEQESAS